MFWARLSSTVIPRIYVYHKAYWSGLDERTGTVRYIDYYFCLVIGLLPYVGQNGAFYVFMLLNSGVLITLEESLLGKSPQEFEYILNDVTYDTEDALHAADASTCSAGEHDWKKSFSYGRYSCKKCDAIRMKIK